MKRRRKMVKQGKLFSAPFNKSFSESFSKPFEENNASLEHDLDTFSFNEAFEIIESNRVYLEGVEASAKKQPVTDNPYSKSTDNHNLWLQGWSDQIKGIARYKPGIDL